jgi:hypothetical protein
MATTDLSQTLAASRFSHLFWKTIVIHFRRFTIWSLLTFVIVGPLFALFHGDQVSTDVAVALAFAVSTIAGVSYALLAVIISHAHESEIQSDGTID